MKRLSASLVFHIILMVYFIIMSVYVILRAYLYLIVGVKPVDLLIFNQSLATTIKGEGFFYNDIEGVSHFGVHNSPILFFLLPIYYLYPSIETLLVVQTLAITLGAIPIYKAGIYILRSEWRALAFVVLYLLSPFILGVLRFDFHAVSLAIPFITLSLMYLARKEYSKAYYASIPVLLAREDGGLFHLSTALLLLVEERNWKTVLKFGVTGIAWILVSLAVISYFSSFKFYNRYTGEILWGMVIYLLAVMILTTGGFLLFARSKLALVLIPFLELALSNYWAMLTIGDHYQWLLGPIVIFTGIYGAQHVNRGRFWLLFLIGFVFSILLSPVFSPLYPKYLRSPYLLGTRLHIVFEFFLKDFP